MISSDEVKKIARLAHLHLEDGEIPDLSEKLSSILDFVRKLQSVDVSGITPMSHVHGSTNVFREDQCQESLDVKALSQNAPDLSGRFIRVPIIVE